MLYRSSFPQRELAALRTELRGMFGAGKFRVTRTGEIIATRKDPKDAKNKWYTYGFLTSIQHELEKCMRCHDEDLGDVLACSRSIEDLCKLQVYARTDVPTIVGLFAWTKKSVYFSADFGPSIGRIPRHPTAEQTRKHQKLTNGNHQKGTS